MIFPILSPFLTPTLNLPNQSEIDFLSWGTQEIHFQIESISNTSFSQSTQISYKPLVTPEDQVLKKLKDYKEIITNENPDYVMVFMRIPYSTRTARDYAQEVAGIVKEYETYWFVPIIIFEPSDGNRGATLEKIKDGACDAAIQLFFSLLSSTYNVSEKQLGLIVPYPEINTPAFDRTNFEASDFSAIINNFFRIARLYYPNLRWSILLDSKSYKDDDWGNWEYVSLLPYLNGIDKTYIQSFWLQGFPWMTEDGKTKFFSMRSILPMNLIQEGSVALGTKKIWLNTGTVGRIYTPTTRIAPSERSLTLNSLLMYMRVLKLRWYTPFANIFSQNNLSVDGENTDWSYIQSKEDLTVFWEFIKRAHKSSIKVGFYDQ